MAGERWPMTKHLKLPLRLELVRYSGQTVLNIQFESKALSGWCLALCLLKEGLTAALVISEEGAKGKLELELMSEAKERRTHASFEAETARLRITSNDLDYLLHFFLKYYRDGFAEVDHLDLEVVAANERQDASVTFKVPESAQPLSPEQAKKRLRLE
jgi:hypothetical protein